MLESNKNRPICEEITMCYEKQVLHFMKNQYASKEQREQLIATVYSNDVSLETLNTC